MKTYSDYLKKDNYSIEKRKKHVEFLKRNNILVFPNFYPQEYDYVIYAACLEIYTNVGENYFEKYSLFRQKYGELNYANGPECYCNSSIYYEFYGYDISKMVSQYKEDLIAIIENMIFFEISSYNNLSIDKYKELLNNADKDFKILQVEKDIQNKSKKIDDEATIIKEYYSFKEGSFDEMEKMFNQCIAFLNDNPGRYKITKEGESTLDDINKSIEDEIELNADEKFIVYFYLNDKIVFIGKTTTLIHYIGTKLRSIEFDSVTYMKKNVDDIDYMYTKSLMYFNFEMPSNTIKLNDKHFTTLNIAKKVYKILYKINLRNIKKVIAENDIAVYNSTHVCIIDKIQLDRAIKNTYGHI